MSSESEPLLGPDKAPTVSRRYLNYANSRMYGDAFTLLFFGAAFVLFMFSYFSALYPNGKGITGSGTNSTGSIQAETDKSKGGHEAWDWIIFISALLMLIQTIQVAGLDLFWMRRKEFRTYRTIVEKKDTKECKLNIKNVFTWMYVFLIVHSVAGAWHLINVIHAAVRASSMSSDLEDSCNIAYVYYTLVVFAAVASLAASIIIAFYYGFGIRYFEKACKTEGFKATGVRKMTFARASGKAF
jgi:hypothetical protein